MVVSSKERLIEIPPKLVQRTQTFNKIMKKAERLWGAKEGVLWGYSGENFIAKLPSYGMREDSAFFVRDLHGGSNEDFP